MSKNLQGHILDDLSHRHLEDGESPRRFAGFRQEPLAAQGQETVAHKAAIRSTNDNPLCYLIFLEITGKEQNNFTRVDDASLILLTPRRCTVLLYDGFLREGGCGTQLPHAVALMLRTSFEPIVNMSLLGSCIRGDDENAPHGSAF